MAPRDSPQIPAPSVSPLVRLSCLSKPCRILKNPAVNLFNEERSRIWDSPWPRSGVFQRVFFCLCRAHTLCTLEFRKLSTPPQPPPLNPLEHAANTGISHVRGTKSSSKSPRYFFVGDCSPLRRAKPSRPSMGSDLDGWTRRPGSQHRRRDGQSHSTPGGWVPTFSGISIHDYKHWPHSTPRSLHTPHTLTNGTWGIAADPWNSNSSNPNFFSQDLQQHGNGATPPQRKERPQSARSNFKSCAAECSTCGVTSASPTRTETALCEQCPKLIR